MYQHRVKSSAPQPGQPAPAARPAPVNNTAYASPFWEGAKAFGRQVWEPFSGAANYWSGGRVGSDFKDDSMWVDVNRRVANAMPGREQYDLTYKNNPMLDASAIATGVSGLSAAGAAAALAAPMLPHAAQFMRAAPAARNVVGLAGQAGQVAKGLLGPAATLSAGRAFLGFGLGAGDAYAKTEAQKAGIINNMLAQGASAEEAERLANKMTWGGMWNAAKEYITHPYHYIYRQGGSNPIDQRFVDATGGIMPHNAEWTAREGLGLVTSNPAAFAAKALVLYPLLNKMDNAPAAIQQMMQAGQQQMQGMPAQAMQTWANTGVNPMDQAKNMLDQSRMYNSIAQYYGNDWPAIQNYFANQAGRALGFNQYASTRTGSQVGE